MHTQVVKNERNKTHSQILVMQQLNAELADKSKILANEIDILGAKAVEDNKWVAGGIHGRGIKATPTSDNIMQAWKKKCIWGGYDVESDHLKVCMCVCVAIVCLTEPPLPNEVSDVLLNTSLS